MYLYTYRDSSPKNEKSAIIYSGSSLSKPVKVSSVEHKRTYLKKIFVVLIMNIDGVQC